MFLKLYKQLVCPHLEYACIIWNPWLKRDIQKIERVQHHATSDGHLSRIIGDKFLSIIVIAQLFFSLSFIGIALSVFLVIADEFSR